jgi:predicted transcriptional regulator
MTVKDLITKEYQLLTNEVTLDNYFNGCYSTDLLSAAISSAKPNNILITIISNQNTIAVAMMIDLLLVIIAENKTVSKEMIDKANEENICILKTKYKTFEVIIDLYTRGLI